MNKSKYSLFSLPRSLPATLVIKSLRSMRQLSESGGAEHYLNYKEIKLGIHKSNGPHQSHPKSLRELTNAIARLPSTYLWKVWVIGKSSWFLMTRKRQMSHPFSKQGFPRGGICRAVGESAQPQFLRKAMWQILPEGIAKTWRITRWLVSIY